MPKDNSSSLEGNTNLDALVCGNSNASPRYIFIEAKFLSDISKDIQYYHARNQIARNIDCALDFCTDGGRNPEGIDHFWFALLTPGTFRTENYRPKTENLKHYSDQSRFYCYKMDDYKSIDNLKADLPHWVLTDEQWINVSSRIGWLTFEDFICAAQPLIGNPNDRTTFNQFFKERGIIISP